MPESTPWYLTVNHIDGRDAARRELRAAGFNVDDDPEHPDILIIRAAPGRSIPEVRDEFKALDELVASVSDGERFRIGMHGATRPAETVEEFFAREAR